MTPTIQGKTMSDVDQPGLEPGGKGDESADERERRRKAMQKMAKLALGATGVLAVLHSRPAHAS